MWVFSAVRQVLAFEMTIAEWIGAAAILAVPQLLVGMKWTAVAGGHLGWQGYARKPSILASIVSWPVLPASTVCTM
jgi:hypothetical protein